jgi:hypothetical protein
MMTRKLALTAMSLAAAALAGASAAQPTDAQITLRQRLTDPDVNMLTFRSIGEMFETTSVQAGDGVWELPRAEAPLDFSYEFGGETIPAADFGDRTYTNALLILKDGAIVHERYYNFSDAETHFLSMSTAKSLTSTLIGMAVADGLIGSVDDLVTDYVPELRDSGYAGVSIREALMMRSGVDWNERYDFENQTPMAMLHHGAIVENRYRFSDAALELERSRTPGETFNYSTVETAVLGRVLEGATGMPLPQYMSERWWKPAGMEADGFWLADGPPGVGKAVSGMGFNAVLRDFGRIGQMMLNGGEANGRQLLPPEWVEQATVPAPGNEPVAEGASQGYQYQWWTLTGSDAYMAVGLQGQFIYVDPATDTVVVKLSYFPPAEQRASAESEAFFRAVSAWEPSAP